MQIKSKFKHWTFDELLKINLNEMGQVKNVDALIVPVGGGGLIAGVALAVKSLYPNIKGIHAHAAATL